MPRDDKRTYLKTNQSNWKLKLRENCYRRIKEDRSSLLWRFRLNHDDDDKCPPHNQELVKSTFQNIVADELDKIRDIELDENSSPKIDDPVWEYEGLHTAYQGECEEILLEMQRIFYEDIGTPPAATIYVKTWEDEEDEFLARAVYEHMELNEKQEYKVVWCPICKRGELQETQLLIYCTLCDLKLDKGDEVNLVLLETRLGEAHAEHLDRGCRLKPKFCIDSGFGLNALCIVCQGCSTFEVVL